MPSENYITQSSGDARYASIAGAPGAWLSWTPTLTNVTLGNGTLTGKYIQVGRTTFFRWKLVFGTTTTINSTPVQFTLPVAPAAQYAGQDPVVGNASYLDQGTASYYGITWLSSGSTCNLQVWTSSGATVAGTTISDTVPFTFGDTDGIQAWGTYEAAS